MGDFVRARRAEQKQERMDEVKTAADRLFMSQPYSQISLTSIARELSWTRANLYKYVGSKEDIFLDLCGDKMDSFFEALLAALPAGATYSADTYAQVWSEILYAHRDFLHYSDILHTVIETNVSIQRLAAFKLRYYDWAGQVNERLASNLGTSQEAAYDLFLAVHYHAVGIASLCRFNPLVEEALRSDGLTPPQTDFRTNVREFIRIALPGYAAADPAQD
ncbi:TetR family transcriptional regulator [Bombiscardovia nodaiensis]|uniref:TetR family transcriptional regulator n=1 Tax=Bombiscardovia nodaiensis TaxID=2932181 RepID=A0ABN6S8H5_9BIFI|nr:TetR family transcriptional regulator [Bombiscardovia nodaiensis]